MTLEQIHLCDNMNYHYFVPQKENVDNGFKQNHCQMKCPDWFITSSVRVFADREEEEG